MPARRKPTTDSARPSAPPPAAAAPSLQSRFDGVLGARRGLTDARAGLARLNIAERELERAQLEARRLQVEYDTLSDGAAALGERLTQQTMQLQERDAELLQSHSARDRARYALVRATGSDLFPRSSPDVHHGLWTPGRPYLSCEHVYDEDGHCYRAPERGVTPGHRPGVSNSWLPCADDAHCPQPDPLPWGLHPVDARAVRQDIYWWDKHGTKYELGDLSDEHLQGVIAWLHDHAQRHWVDQIDAGSIFVPCPAQAYLDADGPHGWLGDTPLMRALEAEATRCESVADKSPPPAAHSTRKRPR